MNKRFEALDAFRGICALSVVIFHMHWTGTITELNFFKGSSIFVEFFFVLSGFVLTHAYGAKENINFKSFMGIRFFRLYPLHFFCFLCIFIFQGIKYLAFKYSDLSFGSEPFTGLFAPNEIIPNLLLLQSWTSFTNPLSFNYPSWSISIEFYMYALLFLTIILFKSKKILSWFSISFISFIVIFLEYDIFNSTVLRGLSCFFGGAFIYFIYKKISHIMPSYTLGSIIETLLITSIILVVQAKFEYRAIFASLIFMFTILFFAFESGFFSKILKKSSLQYAGKLSYSIYMIHAVFLMYLGAVLKILNKATNKDLQPIIKGTHYIDLGNNILNNMVVLSIVIIIIYISNLTYKHIELNGQKLGKKLNNSRKNEH